MPRAGRVVLVLGAALALTAVPAAFPQQPPAPFVQARNVTIEEDQTFNDVIATFESFRGPPSAFTVSVNWGDGSSSGATYDFTGTTSQRGFVYRASASHRYTSSGSFTITVTVTDSAGLAGTGTSTATVTRRQAPPPPPPPPSPPPPPPAPLPADLTLAQTQEPGAPRAGGVLQYTFTVRNGGPGTATGVTLTNTPPAGSAFVSAGVAASVRTPAGGADACTSPPAGPLSCTLGTLAAGAVVTVTHVVRLGSARVASNSAQVAAASTDPATANNATAGQLQVGLPPPVLGRSANAAPVSGTVLVRLPGSNRFVPLTAGTQLPMGTVVDTRRGRVSLQTARGGGPVDTAQFYQGQFRLFQARTAGSFTELRLFGGSFATCPRGLRQPAQRGKPPSAPVRRLWGDGRGRFRTRGRFASASVRGTRWLTVDRCDGTLLRIQVGRVEVRDLVRARTIQLRAGPTYLARARR